MDIKDKSIFKAGSAGGAPFKSYIKTILGRVYVTVWNPFEDIPEGVILYGDPRKQEESCIVDVFNEQEDYFFRTKNKLHLQTGDVIAFVRKEEEKERTPEEFSDEELKEVLSKPFFSIQKLVNDTVSVALLFRIKNLAQEMEKSEKVISTIEARLSEVQAAEFAGFPSKLETEI
jgi:hypothetical protein